MPYQPKRLDRYQVMMNNLDGMVAWDSIARIIDCYVEHADLEEMGFTKTEPSFEGRPCYSPQSMLKLYLYGYRKTIRSSRRLADACLTNIEVMWMLDGQQPDFRTISDFRKDNIDCLKKVFKDFVRRIMEGLETGFISIDGSKFRAVNSKDRNFTMMKLDDRIKWLEDHTMEYLRLIEKADQVEDDAEELLAQEAQEATETTDAETLTKEELEKKLQEAQERLNTYRALRTKMEEENLSQISLTDPDSRLMKSQTGYVVGFNVQTAVDSEHHIIMDYDVTSNVTDHGCLAPTTEELSKESDGVIDAVADMGYDQDEDMVACLENGVIPHVILPDGKDEYEIETEYEEAESLNPDSTDPQELKKCLHAGVIPKAYEGVITGIEVVEVRRKKEDPDAPKPTSPYGTEEEMKARAAEGFFVRDPERDLIYCPGGNTLRRKSVKPSGATRYANKHACNHCPFRNRCVSDKGITKWKEMDFSKDSLERPAKWWKSEDTTQPETADPTSTSDSSEQKKDDSNKKDPPNPPKKKRQFEKVKLIRFKLKPDRKKMGQRLCLSEHPFGTLKRALGASYFLLKGKQKNNGEFALMLMGYNLVRGLNIHGFWGLMQRVKG